MRYRQNGKTGQIKVNLNCDVSNINFDDQKNYLTRDIPKIINRQSQ